MEDLVFVPCKSVPHYRERGYGIVPGNTTPDGWAVLMQKGLSEEPLPVRRETPARNGRKLNEQDVLNIRALRGVKRQTKIAAEYGISDSTVFEIMHGKSWAWL